MTTAWDTWSSMMLGAIVFAVAWACMWSWAAVYAKRNDVADIAWGLFFPFLALVLGGSVFLMTPAEEPRAVLVIVLVSIWGLRLSLHILRRVIDHREEDKRYARMRAGWNGRHVVLRTVLQVFVLQAFIALVIAQPVLIATCVAVGGGVGLGWLDLVALLVVIAGFWLEATADRQLDRFLKRRAAGQEEGRYLTRGVWSWSRHPNYAGDAIVWLGFGLFGIAAALDIGSWWLLGPAIVGPLAMWWLLRFGSGVPITERDRAGNPEWDAYVARTSTFFPRPPRSA
jgi:steroid 5-alpha reductase family enzyme